MGNHKGCVRNQIYWTHLSKSEAHLYPFEWTLRRHGCHHHRPPHLDSTDYLLHLNVEGGKSLTNGEKMSFLWGFHLLSPSQGPTQPHPAEVQVLNPLVLALTWFILRTTIWFQEYWTCITHKAIALCSPSTGKTTDQTHLQLYSTNLTPRSGSTYSCNVPPLQERENWWRIRISKYGWADPKSKKHLCHSFPCHCQP